MSAETDEAARNIRERLEGFSHPQTDEWREVRIKVRDAWLAVQALSAAGKTGNGSSPQTLSPAPRGEEGWEPIETAPKDGTRILLLLEPLPHHEPFRDETDWRDIGSWTDFNGGGWVHHIIGQPIAWRHLPLAAAPKAPGNT